MRKLVSTLLVLVMALSMAACGTGNAPATTTGATTPTVSETTAPETTVPEAAAPETVTIRSLNGSGELVDVTLPYDPQRLVMLDLACLDYIDNLGLGDRVVGSHGGHDVHPDAPVRQNMIVNIGQKSRVGMESGVVRGQKQNLL